MALVTAVAGLGFGDEGKGTTVDFLTRNHRADLVVRYNGGAQAGHNVVTPDGHHHCFAQWGSGTFAGAKTLLSRHMIVNPIFALAEARYLEKVSVRNPLSYLYVEDEALITTPFHVAANRLKELSRGSGRHGSCGMGVGETQQDANACLDDVLTAGMLRSSELGPKLRRCQERKREELQSLKYLSDVEWSVLSNPAVVEETMEAYARFATGVMPVDSQWLPKQVHDPRSGHILFEGAQGVLLDEWWGFHPYTTWSTCTFENVKKLLGDVPFRRLGVLRSFHTRHGAGPFPTESPDYAEHTKDDHNIPTPWQSNFRAGPLDMVLARYAIHTVGGCDGLVLTHMDKPLGKICWAYEWEPVVIHDLPRKEQLTDLDHQEGLGRFLQTAKPVWVDDAAAPKSSFHAAEFIAEALHTPLALVSTGPTAKSKILL